METNQPEANEAPCLYLKTPAGGLEKIPVEAIRSIETLSETGATSLVVLNSGTCIEVLASTHELAQLLRQIG